CATDQVLAYRKAAKRARRILRLPAMMGSRIGRGGLGPDELDAAVEGPVSLARVRNEGLGHAVALGRQAARVDAVRNEVGPDRVSALAGKLQVVGRVAHVVGVALNLELDVRV